MSLEDLSGNRFLDSLNPFNPVGPTDLKNEGDDHIRGIKNVLKKTFPNVAGAIILTHTQINKGVFFDPGVSMVFYEDTAPLGWTIQNTLDDKLLFVSKGSAAGGKAGGSAHDTGSWSISGITVDAHIHTVGTHTHGTRGHVLTVDEIPSHTHGVYATAAAGWYGGPYVTPGGGDTVLTTATGGGQSHSHGDTASGGVADTGAASSSSITSAGTWRPAAYVAIICDKS